MLVKHKFEKRPERPDTKADRAKLALDIYNDHYKDKLDKMNALPEGWLPTEHYVHVKLGASIVSLNFSGSSVWTEYRTSNGYGKPSIGEYKRVLHGDYAGAVGRAVLQVYDSDHKFTQIYEEIIKLETEYDKEYRELRSLAQANVSKFTTTKQLIEAWPEIEPFVIAVYAGYEKPKMDLVVARNDLNEKFSLPVEKKVKM